MSRGVLAMRLRLALLRQKIPVEIDRLLVDSVYAAEVLAVCESTEQADLISLAKQVVLGDEEPPAAGTASPAVLSSSSRLHLDPRPAGGAAAETASRPMPTAASTTGGAATGSDDSPASEPGDPDAPRNRRYLRGAR